ncbi:hypothetical protein LOD99_10845 [Oopsacas minuta]|uniref:Uncharacterized protein n=1 Tax=Oopsacas minuta TaxID=111878 RepID=A0AAV7KE76_9METZ|nr:hypothetical protein LOD99_10845 [Oopsacas minuta]
MVVMRSAIEALGMNERDKEELQATIARLESAVTQLREENEQLLEQQSRGATAQVGRSTQSLPSFVSPIRSNAPKMGVSRDGLDESLPACSKWSRARNLRSTSQCKPPARFW